MEYAGYKKNDIVRVEIEDIGNDGEGIGKVDGYTLFVKDAVIGDVVQARITKCKKNYGYARVEKVETPSPFRVEPKCSFYRQCGGCQIQALQYEKQLAYKQSKVRANLLRIGGFAAEQIDAVMEPIVGMEEPWHYRNKAQYPVGYDKKGNLVAGFYAGRTHDIIANTDCPLGPPENQVILESVLSYMRENHVSAYRESSGEGLVRHVLIRTGFSSGEIMVCLVINGKALPEEEKLAAKLKALDFEGVETADACFEPAYAEMPNEGIRRKRIVSISTSENMEKTNVIMGKKIRVLWGSDHIEDSLKVLSPVDFSAQVSPEGSENDRIIFHISPLSFYQVNPRQTERLYGLALEYAGLTGGETVWDLYCGIGTISLFMAKKAKKVYGVEVVPQAIEDARENARRNGISNAEFYVGRAEEVLPAFYEKAEDSETDKRHPDVIVVDPPRKGCDEKCLETMLAMRPDRIVYVSCDSATLARDVKILCGGGYEIRKVRAVDQFGHTCHVEAIIMMQYCGAEKNLTLNELIQRKGFSRYRLSKVSGVSWETVSNLCSGKIKFEHCDAAMLSNLSKVLEIGMEELLLLEAGDSMDGDGKPKDKEYLETGLPESLRHALDEFIQGEIEQVSHMDCLWGELYGSINACQWGGRITKEQADYLRKKYLFGDKEVEMDD